MSINSGNRITTEHLPGNEHGLICLWKWKIFNSLSCPQFVVMNLVHERLQNELLQNFQPKHTVNKYELFFLCLWICPLFIAGRRVCVVAFKLHHFAYREGSVRFSQFTLYRTYWSYTIDSYSISYPLHSQTHGQIFDSCSCCTSVA